MENSISKILKLVTLKFLLVTALFLGALLLFVFIADEVVLEHEDAFDQKVHQIVLAHTTPGLIETMRAVTFLGSSYFLLPAYLIILSLLVILKKYRHAIDIGVIAVSSFILMALLKQLFHRDRPNFPIIKGITSFSFPSGHSLSSFIFCCILGYLVWKGSLSKSLKVLSIIGLLMVTSIIGISRVVLNVHYATDVIAGFCFGLMWVILSLGLLRYFFPIINNGKSDLML